MSDEGEIDVESDDVAEGGDVNEDFSGKCLDKRAHHNALERKRRDHIKDSFTNLRDCIPSLSGEKVSRAHVLNKATEYIREMQRNSAVRSMEIDELKKKNEILEEQVNALEQAQEIGSSENPEDLIASIAEKVQQRQSLRQQQQQQQQQQSSFTNKSKVQLEPAEPSDKSSSSEPVSQPSSINILANNIRTTQNLLSALAKNLPSNSSNSQMRSIAARVLASPLRPQVGSTSTSTPPRGVVTATTVPLLAATNEPVKVLSVEAINSLAGGMPPSSNVATTVSTGANISDGVVLVSEGDNNLLTSEDKEPPSKRLKTELEC